MKGLITFLIAVMLFPTFAEGARTFSRQESADSVPRTALSLNESGLSEQGSNEPGTVYLDEKVLVKVPEGVAAEDGELPADSVAAGQPLTVVTADDYPYGLDGKKIFNPDPTRAVWLSALFPGLGQIYNRRYWKLPIVVAGYMGLGYGTSWNARMYSDYSLAYSDIMDDDPDTKSYLDFFPPNVDESSLDTEWLKSTLKSRKDFYRRNRDLCIICCVGLYLLCMLDAYVDAHLAHFDISEDISMDLAPTILSNPGMHRPMAALNWTFTF